MRDNFRDLLAGYATGTLTEAERKALFEAALHDPELFAEIANEEPLRELLSSPRARAELLERVAPAEHRFVERLALWMRRPAALAAAGVAGAAIAVVAILPAVRNLDNRPRIVAGIASPAASGVETAPAPAPAMEAPARGERAAAPAPKQTVAPREASAPRASNAPPSSAATGRLGGPVVAAQVAQADSAPATDAEATRAREYVPGPAPGNGSVKSFAAPPAAATPSMVAMAPPPPPARAMAAKTMALREVAVAPLRYEVETGSASGEFAAANALELKDGDIVRIRFRPSISGLITIRDASAASSDPIFTRLVSASAEFATEPIRMDRDRRLDIVFTRLDEQANNAARADQAVDVTAAAPVATPFRAAGVPAGAHLLASPAADANGRVAFSIELRRKP